MGNTSLSGAECFKRITEGLLGMGEGGRVVGVECRWVVEGSLRGDWEFKAAWVQAHGSNGGFWMSEGGICQVGGGYAKGGLIRTSTGSHNRDIYH